MDIPPLPGWLALLLAASTSVHSLSAQIPAPLAVPPGHQSRVTYVEPASAFDLHGFAVDPRSEAIYVASRDRVIRRDRHGGETLVHQLGQGDATLMFAAPARWSSRASRPTRCSSWTSPPATSGPCLA
jgi:hypothetical protein